MIDDITADIEFNKTLRTQFAFATGVSRVVLKNIPVSNTATATVFFDKGQNLYAYISTRSKTALSDIRKILSRMSLKPLAYLPPAGNADYFDTIALAKYMAVFPGRKYAVSEDLIYYRTLVPYNPALVQIAEIKDGVIKMFDSDSSGSWRVATKLSYKK